MKHPTFLPYVIGFLLMNAPAVFAGQTTLTTYYPAPSGNYDKLRLFPTSTAPNCSSANDIGTLYVDNSGTLQYCANGTAWGTMGGAWTQSGNYIYPSNTVSNPNINVGIGNTNPAYKLDVSGDIGTGAGSKLTTAAGNDLNIDTPAARSIFLKVGGSTKVTVANTGDVTMSNNAIVNGSVGIGVAAPAQKLHVKNGDVFIDRGVGTNASLGLRSGGGSSTWITQGPMLMSIGFGGSPPVTPGTSGPINIDANAGRVAIGANTNLLNKLDVNGGMAVGSYAGVNSAPANSLIVSDGLSVGSPAAPPNAGGLLVNGSARIAGTITGGSYAASVDPNIGMIVRGIVGIGTPAPNVKLTIVGSSGGYDINTPILRLQNNAKMFDLATRFDMGAPGGSFTIADNTRGVRLAINDNGVGVGISNPTFAFDVVGNTRMQGTLRIWPGGAGPAQGYSDPVCFNQAGWILGRCNPPSSIRYKEDIKPLVVDKDKVLQLKPVDFKWKDRDERSFGLIAEEVEPLVPNLVFYKDGKAEGVNYDKVGVYLLSIVKEHEQRLNDVQKRDMVLHDTDGPGCHKITVNSAGALSAAAAACP